MKRVATENRFSLKLIFKGISDILNNKENIENPDIEELTPQDSNVTEDVLKELKKSDESIATMEKTWGTVPIIKKAKKVQNEPKLNREKAEVRNEQEQDIQKETEERER